MSSGTSAISARILLLLVVFGASSGCVATTRELWHGTASSGDVQRLSLATGCGGSSLVIHAEGDQWLLPLAHDGRLPVELDASRWGGWSLDELRADDQARALLSAEPSHAVRYAWSKIRRSTKSDFDNHEVVPLHTRIFRVGDRAVIAFFGTASDRLPVSAVLLPERMPRTCGNRARGFGRALALTPITLALDAVGTAVFVPAALVLNPRYVPNMLVWVNSDEGEFPPPLLFRNQEER